MKATLRIILGRDAVLINAIATEELWVGKEEVTNTLKAKKLDRPRLEGGNIYSTSRMTIKQWEEKKKKENNEGIQ